MEVPPGVGLLGALVLSVGVIGLATAALITTRHAPRHPSQPMTTARPAPRRATVTETEPCTEQA